MKMNPTEHQEQVALCSYLDMHAIPYLAIPNGGSRNIIEAVRLKRAGVKRGAPDLLIFLDNGKNIACEMKTRTGGRVSSEQDVWQRFFANRPLWIAMICNGAQEAINKIKEQNQ